MIEKRFLAVCAVAGWMISGSVPLSAAAPAMDGIDTLPAMIFIPGGCFEMGDLFEPEGADRHPVHTVCLDDYYIGETEVTQAVWTRVMGSEPVAFFRDPDYPVEEASWSDAAAFLKALNIQTKRNYRLPTEAEWEFAARERGEKKRWSGTDNPAEISKFAWYEGDSGGRTHPVRQKLPNRLGLYDMSGNVWEWVQDHYAETYYQQSPRWNPRGPGDGKYYVLRGGSYNSRPESLRADFRLKDSADKRFNYFCGFRLALSPAR